MAAGKTHHPFLSAESAPRFYAMSLRRDCQSATAGSAAFSQSLSFHGSDKRSSNAAIRPLDHSPVLMPIMAA